MLSEFAPYDKGNNEKETERELISKTLVYINAGGRGTRLSNVITPDPEKGVW